MTIASVTHSQNSDSNKVWIPRNDAKRVLIAAKQQEITQRQLDTMTSIVADLTRQIANYRSIVDNDKATDSVRQAQIAALNDALAKAAQQKALYEQDIAKLKKSVKHANLWTRLTSGVGLAGITLLAILLAHK